MIDDCKEMCIAPDMPQAKLFAFATQSAGNEPTFDLYALSFVDSVDEEICSITGLEFKEAEWMADMILKHR